VAPKTMDRERLHQNLLQASSFIPYSLWPDAWLRPWLGTDSGGKSWRMVRHESWTMTSIVQNSSDATSTCVGGHAPWTWWPYCPCRGGCRGSPQKDLAVAAVAVPRWRDRTF
jgi:hypothetical protein